MYYTNMDVYIYTYIDTFIKIIHLLVKTSNITEINILNCMQYFTISDLQTAIYR